MVETRPGTTYDKFARDFGERFMPGYKCPSAVDLPRQETMSQRRAYSECTVSSPLMAAIMGTSISCMFARAASSMQGDLEDTILSLHPHRDGRSESNDIVRRYGHVRPELR